MITIVIELVATLRNPFPSKKRVNTVEIADQLDLRQLIEFIGFQKEDIEHMVAIVNGVRVLNDYILKDGDHVFLTLPIGGG
ncbi:MoaD/ThiS family protein [Candidatus Hodarchaeum mangrovi]